MINFFNIKNKKINRCEDCIYKIQIGKDRYLCLMNNGIIKNNEKCCSKYSK